MQIGDCGVVFESGCVERKKKKARLSEFVFLFATYFGISNSLGGART